MMWFVYVQPGCTSSDWVLEALRKRVDAEGGSVTTYDISTHEGARYFIQDHHKLENTPQVFLHQKHIGGLAETVKLLSTSTLEDLVKLAK